MPTTSNQRHKFSRPQQHRRIQHFLSARRLAGVIRGWELTLRSPRFAHRGQIAPRLFQPDRRRRGHHHWRTHRFPALSPQLTPLDHDQRNTLNVGGDVHPALARLCLHQCLLRLGLQQCFSRPCRIPAIICRSTRRSISRWAKISANVYRITHCAKRSQPPRRV